MSANKRYGLKFAVLSALLAIFIAGVSTINAVYGTSALPALQYDLRESVDAWVAEIKGSSSDANAASKALAAISPINKSLCGMADAERSRGTLSGSAGAGAISAAYESSCSYTSEIIETIGGISEAQTARRARTNELIEQLQSATYDGDADVFERRRNFTAITSEIEAELVEAELADVSGTLSTQLEGLEASVIAFNLKDGAFGERQSTAIESLRGYFGQIKNSVSDLVAPETSAELLAKPESLLSMGAAIIKYRDRLWPAIILAIAIDVAVLWFAMSLALSNQVLKHRKNRLPGLPHWLDLPFVTPPIADGAQTGGAENPSAKIGE